MLNHHTKKWLKNKSEHTKETQCILIDVLQTIKIASEELYYFTLSPKAFPIIQKI